MQALLQESPATAVRLGAAKPCDFTQVVVDTTMQEKSIAHPTDAKLIHRAREQLVKLAKKHGLQLRQSHVRVGKKALIKCQRYRHAKQFRRANRELRKLEDMAGAGDQGYRAADCGGQDTARHLPAGAVADRAGAHTEAA